MNLAEYQLRMEAYQLQKVEQEEQLALQAWFNQTVQATTGGKRPRPKFKKFDQFFDKQTAYDQVRAVFEEGYTTIHESAQEKKHKTTEIFNKRLAEFNQLKKQGKIIPIDERR
ncbi:hypothetical protein ACNAN0_02525 [Agrilactobacillus fermenti]|uniref:hypothetical protein n=1 Tax=Agrilactobacillus fermenti TaxID=2586909 RepID=UPI001E2D7784|nr:hypothetical protein [Agrilactobacillus fermenti]MCD2256408.1 hypothetical protein [Agrilactobacillus fermenti]